MVENWMADTREYLSARKLEHSAPTRDPKGMAQVMAPWEVSVYQDVHSEIYD